MELRRNSFEIINVILSSLTHNTEGMGPTQIMNCAGITYKLTINYLETLKAKKMVKKEKVSGTTKEVYKLTENGYRLHARLNDLFEVWHKNG